jgi:hypothetical protein
LLCLVAPRRPGVGLRLCVIRHRLQHRRLQVVTRKSMSTPVWTPNFSVSLPCCAWSSLSWLLCASRRFLAPPRGGGRSQVVVGTCW